MYAILTVDLRIIACATTRGANREEEMRAKSIMALSATIMVSMISLTSGQLDTNSPWPMFRCNLKHTGLSAYAGPSIPFLAWSYKAGLGIWCSPSIGSDGKVYVGSQDNSFYSINSDASLSWSYGIKAGNQLNASPAIGSDGKVYVGSYDNCLYSINSNASLDWSYQTGYWVISSPAIGSDGKVYVGSSDNYLYSINSNASLGWSYQTGGGVYSSPAIGSDGKLHVGSNDSCLYSIQQQPTPTATITPTPTVTPGSPTVTPVPPTATPTPVLQIIPSELWAGRSCTLEIQLHEDINEAFDLYILAEGQCGPYTLYLNNSAKSGIASAATNIQGFKAPFSYSFTPSIILPMTSVGKQITFYIVAVNAGKIPPVSSLSQLTATMQYVIMFDKQVSTVNP